MLYCTLIGMPGNARPSKSNDFGTVNKMVFFGDVPVEASPILLRVITVENVLLAATNTGILVCQRGDTGWQIFNKGLANNVVTCVIARDGLMRRA